METLAIIILTRNESRNIAACLKSARGADELVVIDDFSQDDTPAQAEALGAKVIQRALNGDYAGQRNFALSQIKSDWVFYLDADERLTPKLTAGLRNHINSGILKAGLVKRENYAFGRRHRFGVLRPDRVARLFPRDKVVWEGLVHESPKTPLALAPIAGALKHHTYQSWQHYFNKANHYTTIWANGARQKGKRASRVDLFFRPWWSFFKVFILNGGILDGPVGWVLCYYHFGYTLAKYLKLKELEK